jgi:hypothetical protein
MRRVWILLAAAACAKDEGKGGPGFEVLGANTTVGGDGLDALGASWTRWTLEHPLTNHPVMDTTGADCAESQPGDLFFLAGNFDGSPVSRTCTATNGGPFLLPIYNAWYDNCGTPPESVVTDEYLQTTVESLVDAFDHATLVIDGQTVAEDAAFFADYRTGVTRFSWENPPADGLYDSWGYPFVGTCDPSFTDGFYLPIAFDPGEHTLSLVAGAADFELSIDYALTVP